MSCNSSENYVWSTTKGNILGRGAIATVYKGTHKKGGGIVAVKTFEVPWGRETAILSKLKHPNIVEFIAVEHQQCTKSHQWKDVLITKYCSGGSLHQILREPENFYGLCEEDVLLVLEHVTAGIRYLRNNDIMHGDIKPGNIAKVIRPNGAGMYQLIDFGAARYVQDGQCTKVNGGTEEYVHPDVYETLFMGIGNAQSKRFPPNVDMWSLGVTFFEVASGTLPFRPFNGRRDQPVMLEMMRNKPPSAISGVQLSPDNKIQYCASLPAQCHLSLYISEEVSDLIKTIMEPICSKICSYSEYYAKVAEITDKMAISIFNVSDMELMKLYVSRGSTHEFLKSRIKDATGIKETDQLLIHQSKAVTEDSGQIKFITDEPLFVFSQRNYNIRFTFDHQLPSIDNEELLSGNRDIIKDVGRARKAFQYGQLYKRKLDQYWEACQHLNNSVTNFWQYLANHLKSLYSISKLLDEKWTLINSIFGKVERGETPANWAILYQDLKLAKSHNEKFMSRTVRKIAELHETYRVKSNLNVQWDKFFIRSDINTFLSRTEDEIKNLKALFDHLVRDRDKRFFLPTDSASHQIRCKQITIAFDELLQLYTSIASQCNQFAHNYRIWYVKAQSILNESMTLKIDIEAHWDQLRGLESNLIQNLIDKSDEKSSGTRKYTVSCLTADNARLKRLLTSESDLVTKMEQLSTDIS